MKVVFGALLMASLLAIPAGVWCGLSQKWQHIMQPMAHALRYLPLPLLVMFAVTPLVIYNAPSLLMIFLAVAIQQTLRIAKTTRAVQPKLSAASLNQGSLLTSCKLVTKAALPQIYQDVRVMLGWAWGYFIVLELLAISAATTAWMSPADVYPYLHHMFVTTLVIGVIALLCDVLLGKFAAECQEDLVFK